MNTLKIHAICLTMLFFVTACIKSKTPSGPAQTPTDLKGTWYVDYYIAANIYAANPGRKDTTFAKHPETWILKGDSLYTHLWYATKFDQTKSPPVFSASDTTESINVFGGRYNGTQILASSSNRTDTIDIVSLTNNQLQIHQAMPASRGFSDLYMILKR